VVRVERLGLIISPDTHPQVGTNIQGPTVIRVPAWVEDPLGTYLLYFADHKGDHIRLAYAEHIAGPWIVYDGGCLALADSRFLTSAPDADDDQVEFIMAMYDEAYGGEPTCVCSPFGAKTSASPCRESS